MLTISPFLRPANIVHQTIATSMTNANSASNNISPIGARSLRMLSMAAIVGITMATATVAVVAIGSVLFLLRGMVTKSVGQPPVPLPSRPLPE